MKKIISVVVSLVMVVSLSAVLSPVASANPDEMVVIYVSVPDDWENPGFWAWGSEGNVFDAWPGDELEALPDNPGWYFIHVPAWASGGLVNANAGSIQTNDFDIDGADLWVTVAGSEDEFEVTDEPLTTGDRPEYVPRYTIYARVPDGWSNPSFWAWGEHGNVFDSWPGEEMTDDGDWFKIRIPTWGNNVIVNANDGDVQSENIEDMPGTDMWIILEERAGENARANVFFSNPDFADAPMITVRAFVPALWGDDIRLWAWGVKGDMFSSWPGGELTQAGDWWEIEVEGWADNFIISGDNGSMQTGDMTNLDTGVDIWFVVTDAATYEYFYEEPEVSAIPEAPPVAAPEPAPEPIPESTPEPPPPAPESSNNILWIILGVVGACGVAAVAFIAIKKKK
jgi:hypothetical protein